MKREDDAPPAVTAEWGWRYHHLGIPTGEARPGEYFIESLGMYVSGFETSPYGVQWMRFAPGSPIPEPIRSVPHPAFVVDDLEEALRGKQVLTPPNSPSPGVRVAMIVDDGCPIELMQFSRPAGEDGEAELRAVIARIDAAWRRKEYAGLEECFHAEALIVGPGHTILGRGRERCAASYREFAENVEVLEYAESGHALHRWGAAAVYTFSWRMTYRRGAETRREQGTDQLVFARNGRRWELIYRCLLTDPTDA